MDNNITFEQAAEKLKVSRQTIYNYIEKGLLTPVKKFNNRVYFDNCEVERLLEPVGKIPFADQE